MAGNWWESPGGYGLFWITYKADDEEGLPVVRFCRREQYTGKLFVEPNYKLPVDELQWLAGHPDTQWQEIKRPHPPEA